MNMSSNKYKKCIVTELKAPESSPEQVARYAEFARRILWMDNNVVEGAFQMNCSWYLRPTKGISEPHSHEYDEIIGFFSSNPEDPYELDGEIEFWLEDEQYFLTKTCMIFVPAGMKHCPLILKRVDRPIFHFTTVNGGQYKPIPAQ
jgi:hypothetical protein